MSKTYIYGIRDLELDKYIYIGKSNKPEDRFKRHLSSSHNTCVQKSIVGKEETNFQIEILEEVEFEVTKDWIKRERFWIKKFKEDGHPLCNANKGGSGPSELSEETKTRMKGRVPWNRGIPATKETKTKKSKSMREWHRTHEHPRGFLGKHPTEEARQAQSKRFSGIGNPNYGKFGNKHNRYGAHHTEETITRMSKAKQGENNPMFGKHHSGKTRNKMSKQRLETPYHTTSYPAFYNVNTNQFIPAGRNLMKMCRENNLSYRKMYDLMRDTQKSWDGWQVVEREGEIKI